VYEGAQRVKDRNGDHSSSWNMVDNGPYTQLHASRSCLVGGQQLHLLGAITFQCCNERHVFVNASVKDSIAQPGGKA